MKRVFPEDFIIGTASASYQVEGAAGEGGREESIWDLFSRRPGCVYAGENGNVAIDQYHRYREDIALMHNLGFQSYRFSISWCRIIRRDGSVNEEGLAYYRALCNELKRYGMKAVATLYHWDLPQYIEEMGGWRVRECAYLFEKYAEVCFTALGDLVDMWITLNEPWCISYLSFFYGEHAPGEKGSLRVLPLVIHHLNLAHGLAVRAFRRLGLESRIGITWNVYTNKAAAYVADGRELEALQYDIDCGVFTDPVFKGHYPERMASLGFDFPIEEGDMEIISSRIDFYGLNYYHEDLIEPSEVFPFYRNAPMYQPVTAMGWPVTPHGLVNLLERMNSESGGLEVYITENGAAFEDVLTGDGRVHDRERTEYLSAHLSACLDAIEEGIPLKGYFVWSFTDNFEWAWGYSRRFGIVYIDYKTLRRYVKDSALFMQCVLAERSLPS